MNPQVSVPIDQTSHLPSKKESSKPPQMIGILAVLEYANIYFPCSYLFLQHH